MAQYEYKCKNKECSENNVKKIIDISINEYSEDKLPLCEKCSSRTVRIFSFGHAKNFDGKVR